MADYTEDCRIVSDSIGSAYVDLDWLRKRYCSRCRNQECTFAKNKAEKEKPTMETRPKSYFSWENHDPEYQGATGRGLIRFKDINEVQVHLKVLDQDQRSLSVWVGPQFTPEKHGFSREEQERFYREYKAWLDYQEELEDRKLQPPIIEVH